MINFLPPTDTKPGCSLTNGLFHFVLTTVPSFIMGGKERDGNKKSKNPKEKGGAGIAL